MAASEKKCLFCQAENEASAVNCNRCGMALPDKHPQEKQTKINTFVIAFWAIVIFCIVMIFVLPR